jgi:hypothetical protein
VIAAAPRSGRVVSGDGRGCGAVVVEGGNIARTTGIAAEVVEPDGAAVVALRP